MQINSWAALLIDQLVQQGVTYYCIAPGSRSTPLALAIAAHPNTKTVIHFDERGVAFHALGFAKASGEPAAVVVTSGTAVGNLLPSIMEASQSFIPILLLTADRPPELRDCGANQTIDQTKIFTPFVRWQTELPCPEPSLSANYLRSTIAQAIFRMRDTPKGPVHINCLFREPLTSEEALIHSLAPSYYGATFRTPYPEVLVEWASLFNRVNKGVIIVGSLPYPFPLKAIYLLSEKLKWPIFPDVTSGLRSQGIQGNVIAYYDLVLKQVDSIKPDAILHLGDRIVSKTVQTWLKNCSSTLHFSVSDHPFRQDPQHRVTHRLACSPSLFCDQIMPYLSNQDSLDWLQRWQQYSQNIETSLQLAQFVTESITEPSITETLNSVPEDWGIFLANSMPIRDADLFLFPKDPIAPIFANRGVSGIDGNIATAIGIAQGLQKPVVALLGDQTTLHDLNSLAQLKKSLYPVIFVIINNKGGGIFSFLPEISEKKCFEAFFAGSHDFSFVKAAELFTIPYYHPLYLSEYLTIFHACLENKKSCMIEVVTQRSENLLLHQSFYEVNRCSLIPLLAR